jgi:hypothetical protein
MCSPDHAPATAPQVPLWLGLKAINSTWHWAYTTAAASAAALQAFTKWCVPQSLVQESTDPYLPTGYGRGTSDTPAGSSSGAVATVSVDAVAAAVAAAAASPLPMCGLLKYSQARCSGWGWDLAPCSESHSYMCQLPAQGECAKCPGPVS